MCISQFPLECSNPRCFEPSFSGLFTEKNLLWKSSLASWSWRKATSFWPERLQVFLIESSDCRLYIKLRLFLNRRWSSLERVKWRAPHHWKFSRCSWTGCQIISSRLPFPQKAGLDNLFRCLQTWTVLWFYGKMHPERQKTHSLELS